MHQLRYCADEKHESLCEHMNNSFKKQKKVSLKKKKGEKSEYFLF